MNQLGYFVSEDLFSLVDSGSLKSRESVDFAHWQECQHSQALVDVCVSNVSPVLEEIVYRAFSLIEPECALGGLAHLLAFAGCQQRYCKSEYFLAASLSCQVYSGDDVGPLVVAAELCLEVKVAGHYVEVVCLQQHVRELEERESCVSVHSALEAVSSQHGVDVEVSADLSCELGELARSDPLSVVDADSISRLRLSVLVTRLVYTLIAFVFPLVVKIDELIKELLELPAVLIDRVYCHDLTHVASA